MNWNTLIEKTKNLTEKGRPILKKAKTYGSDAIAFVGKQVEQTPIFIKTEEEYNIEVSKKRSIIIAYDNTNPNNEFVRIMIPVWSSLAWTDTASMRYIELSNNSELSKNLNIQGPIEMRVSYMGNEQYRFNTVEDMKKWWKNRQYSNQNENTIIPNETNGMEVTKDPISEITEQSPIRKGRK